jgi:hypothetical protein
MALYNAIRYMIKVKLLQNLEYFHRRIPQNIIRAGRARIVRLISVLYNYDIFLM